MDSGLGYAYTNLQVTTRPLPADTYKYYLHWRSPYCTKDLSSIKKSTVVYLNVTAPDRSVHEAFFDPVAIGTAVGADGANGVLEPASFSLDGTSHDDHEPEVGRRRGHTGPDTHDHAG